MRAIDSFPNADRVLGKLREFVDTVKKEREKAKSENDEERIEDCKWALEEVEHFISSIEKYLDSVCNAPDRINQFKRQANDRQDYIDYASEEDKSRSMHHSSIIESIYFIERYAKKIFNMPEIFGVVEDVNQSYSKLTPMTVDEKRNMSYEDRKKRRFLGNFGLYMAASLTLDPSIEDKDLLNGFIEGNESTDCIDKKGIKKVKSNAESILGIE